MDPEVLKKFIDAVREVLLRSSGSKRLMAFFVWLACVTLGDLDFNELCITAGALGLLWLLFQSDTPAETKADALSVVTDTPTTPAA